MRGSRKENPSALWASPVKGENRLSDGELE